MIIAKLLDDARLQLADQTDSPLLEAELLLSYVLQKPRAFLLAHKDEAISTEHQTLFQQVLSERMQGKPIAYILKHREFWSLDLNVTEDTLIPRPETECLVEMILKDYPDKKSKKRFLDLGTGTGAIALAIASERPLWTITAIDVSEDALIIARNNAQQLNFSHISFLQSNWWANLSSLPLNKFDIIASNPPYIGENEWDQYKKGLHYEPKHALVSGIDGLDAIKEIISLAPKYLTPNGNLYIEHGFQQGERLRGLFRSVGFDEITTRHDLAGLERVTSGRVR